MNASIDFHLIRNNKYESFEILSKMLFEKCFKVDKGYCFHQLDGRGGDGGVEGYFSDPQGNPFAALQAKYFFKLGKPQINQISDSIRTALKNHPSLKHYWIYLPFDPTGKTSRSGCPETEKLETIKREFSSECPSLSIRFICKTGITSQLFDIDPSGGIRNYFFSEKILSDDCLNNCLVSANFVAGPRYSPENHVQSETDTILDSFTENPDQINNLSLKFKEILKSLIGHLSELVESDIEFIENYRNQLNSLIRNYTYLLEEPFSQKTIQEAEKLYSTHNSIARKFDDTKTQRDSTFKNVLMKLKPTDLSLFLDSPEVRVYLSKIILLTGEAGIGKTHSILSCAHRLNSRKIPCLVTFGSDFETSPDLWQTFRSKLGLAESVSRDELFSMIKACAQHHRHKFMVFIDALNESNLGNKWKNRLNVFLSQIKGIDEIKLCLSIRNDSPKYVNDLLDKPEIYAYRLKGVDPTIYYSSLKSKNIEVINTYYFSNNPLLLKLNSQLPPLLSNQNNLFYLLREYLSKVDQNIQERLNLSNSTYDNVSWFLKKFYEYLISNDVNEIEFRLAKNWIDDGLLCENSTSSNFLEELSEYELIYITRNLNDILVIRPSYQLFSDLFTADAVIQKAKTTDNRIDFNEINQYLNTEHANEDSVPIFITSVLCNECNIEIFDESVDLPIEKKEALFAESLHLRNYATFTNNVIERISQGFGNHELNFYEQIFKLSLVFNHPISQHNLLHKLLLKEEPLIRDRYFYRWAIESFENDGLVCQFVHSILKSNDFSGSNSSQLRSLALILTWLTGCYDYQLRNLAGKALTKILFHNFSIVEYLSDSFKNCSDDYIHEVLCQSAYSAILLSTKEEHYHQDYVTKLIELEQKSSNIVIHDYVELIKQKLNITDTLPIPKDYSVYDSIKEFCNSSNKHSFENDAPYFIRLTSLNDFWTEVVSSELSKFDLSKVGLSTKNVENWFLGNLANDGYFVEDKAYQNIDNKIIKTNGYGRYREGNVHPIFQKKYWTYLHHLIGKLVTIGLLKPDEKLPLSLSIRKYDFTDFRLWIDRAYPSVTNFSNYVIQSHSLKSAWVYKKDITPFENVFKRKDQSGETWISLYFSAHKSNFQYSDNVRSSLIYALESFLIDSRYSSNTSNILEHTRHGIFPSNHQLFLAEYPVIKPLADQIDICICEDLTSPYVQLVRGADWPFEQKDSDSIYVDNCMLLSQPIIEKLNLTWDHHSGWASTNNELVAFYQQHNLGSYLFIKETWLKEFLKNSRQTLIVRSFIEKFYIDEDNRENIAKIVCDSLFSYSSEGKIIEIRSDFPVTQNYPAEPLYGTSTDNLFPFCIKD